MKINEQNFLENSVLEVFVEAYIFNKHQKIIEKLYRGLIEK